MLFVFALVTVPGWVPTLEAQYMAPRQYLRRLEPAQPAAPNPSGLPPGPAVAPAPAMPSATVTNTAKAKAQSDAATKRTVEFQRKRAEGGAASAQYDLGMRHLAGDGVEKSLVEARKWFTLGAKQDHVWSKKKLAELEAEFGPAPVEPAPGKAVPTPAAVPAAPAGGASDARRPGGG